MRRSLNKIVKLTDNNISKLPTPKKYKNKRTMAFHWDRDVIGFGVCVYQTGYKSFIIQFRDKKNITKRITIGACEDYYTSDAREFAEEYIDDNKREPWRRKTERISDYMIENLKFATVKQKSYLVWDSLLPGFGVRVGTHSKTFQVRVKHNWNYTHKSLGKCADMYARDAREMAKKQISEM